MILDVYVIVYLIGWLNIAIGAIAGTKKPASVGVMCIMAGFVAHLVALFFIGQVYLSDNNLRPSIIFQLLGAVCIAAFFLLHRQNPKSGVGLVLPAFTILLILLGSGLEGFAFFDRIFGGDMEPYHIRLVYGHVIFVMIALLAFSFSFLFSIFFILQEKRIKSKTLDLKNVSLPTISFLRKHTSRFMLIGFILFTVGLILGFGTGNSSSHINAKFNARVVLPLIIWCLYAFLIIENFIFGKKIRMILWHNIIIYVLCLGTLFYEIFFLASFP